MGHSAKSIIIQTLIAAVSFSVVSNFFSFRKFAGESSGTGNAGIVKKVAPVFSNEQLANQPEEVIQDQIEHHFEYETSPNKVDIPIFYNLFIKEESDLVRVKKIVAEQFGEFLNVHKPVYVNSIGVPLDFNEDDVSNGIPPLNTTRNPVELLAHYKEASEHVTLKALWDYCQVPEHNEQKVAYLHSKGSFTATSENVRLRRFLTLSTLSEECANMPIDTCNICSGRFSPIPHPHNSGNMWVARCSYIKKLINPEKFELAMDRMQYDDGDIFLACDGRKRYSAEHWAHSHPKVRPCDLYTRPEFTWGYDGLPNRKRFKGNIELHAGPRFELIQYLKTDVGYCRGRGISKQFRINEYIALYNETPGRKWFGHGFLKDQQDWWPYKDYGWVEQTMESREELIKLGYNYHLWEQPRSRPYPLWGKKWHELTGKQRKVLEDVFVYSSATWDEEIRREYKDRNRVNNFRKKWIPNVSFDRCDAKSANDTQKIESWYQRTGDNDKSLRSYVYEAPKKPTDKKRVLIIAAVPSSEIRIMTLWSELECFTEAVDHVIITAPLWAEPFISHVIRLAKKYIPHFINGQVTIESKYFMNNRYDVGLWCDAYNSLKPGSYDEYGMINDSVLALRKFSAIFDNVAHRNVSLSSISYSYTSKGNVGYGPEHYYVLSIFRVFDNEGINIFKGHSCKTEEHPMFCPDLDDNKACIIDNFEIDLAKEYPCQKVHGLYPADSMGPLVRRDETKRIWIKNTRYWRLLVDYMGFPIAKSNEAEQFGAQFILSENIPFFKNNPLMKNCTSKILPHLDELYGIELPSFKIAKSFYKLSWADLPAEMQVKVKEMLGFDEETWDRKEYSRSLVGKKWDDLSRKQQALLIKLECSKLRFNKDRCFQDP